MLLPGVVPAAPPGFRTVFPPAVQRGVVSELRVYGVNLAKQTDLLLPFAAEVRGEGRGESASFTVKPAPDTPPGAYPVRLRTPDGITNLRLLAVTDVPVVRIREPNGRYKNGRLDLSQTQPIQWPCIVAGDRLERDVDAYRFIVKAGDRLTLVSEAWRLGLTPDPLLRLRDATGRMITYAHDTPTLLRDERLDYTFAQAGEYYLEVVSTGGGGWTNHYLVQLGNHDYARTIFPLGGRRGEQVRFTVVNRDGKTSTLDARVPPDPWADQWRLPLPEQPGSLPWTLASGDLPETTEEDAGGEARQLAWPVTVNGRISKPDEEDTYRIAVKPGQQVRVSVEAYQLGSALDGYLLVYDPKGRKLLAKNDDTIGRGQPDPGLNFEVPPGVEEVLVGLRDTLSRGGIEYGYRLSIEQGGTDFFLWLGRKQHPTNEEDVGWHRMDRSDTLNLPLGQEVKLLVSVRRSAKEYDPHYSGPVQGYTGPIQLRALNVPAGVTVKPVVIPEGKTEGGLVFTASEAAPREPFEIVVIGEGTRPDGTRIRRIAERRLYLSDPQIPNLPWNWRVTKVTCVTTRQQEATR